MKQKTVLSTLTLFFLLQSSPLNANNFFWSILTSPVSPYVLFVGFWGFVKAVGKLGLDYGRFENLKNQRVAEAQESADNESDIHIQRYEYLSDKANKKNRKIKEKQKSTMDVLYNTNADCSEKIRDLQSSREKTNKELENNFHLIAENAIKQNLESNNELRKHCDNDSQKVIDITNLRLLAHQKKLMKERKKVERLHKKNTTMLESLDKDITKNHIENCEQIGLLKVQVNNTKHAIDTSTRKNQLELEELEEKKILIAKLKQSLKEHKSILDRVKVKRAIEIPFPKIKESTKKLFYDSEKFNPNKKHLIAN